MPYSLHRTALRPLLPDASETELLESCQLIKQIGETQFSGFLQAQGLAPMWHKALHSAADTTLVSEQVSEHFIDTLHQSRLFAAGQYLLQSQGLKQIKATLDNEDIHHVVYKGCDIRESIYDEPALRTACDIDVLISPDDTIKTIQALIKAGYQLSPEPENISHEVTLFKGNISIDLHWDIMRPGRTRIPMAETLLKSRQEFPTHWGLNNEATLFLMLVHPVFTKYSTTPHSTLVRIVDLAHWIEKKKPDWKPLSDWLETSGTRTAAWITLEWLQQLTEMTAPDTFIRTIQPGKLKRIYLRHWIKQNYSSKFLEHPILIKAAFTLPAHDKLADAINAIKSNAQEKRLATLMTDQLTKYNKS